MLARRPPTRQAMRNILAWTGLVLMIVAFVWMQRTSKPRLAQSTMAQPSAESGPFAVVVLDPGHGGQDSGAMCGGMLEKDLTLDVAKRVDRLLQSEGIATVMTRVGDSYVSLADRATFATSLSACTSLFLSCSEDSRAVFSG